MNGDDRKAPKLKLIVNADRELLEAIDDNDPARVSAWLARGAQANLRDEYGRTPLFLAALGSKDQLIAKHLLDRGADVRARNVNGLTPLHVAAAVGNEARVALFLDRGAEIDARCVDGWTPLHCTAALGRLKEATLLVSRGADVGIRDRDGLTPLDVARAHDPREPQSERRWDALERLLEGFAIASISNATRELVQAIFDNDPHRVSACLARGADVNARGEFWQTPLFLAAPESKDRAIAEQLLARGADVRARDEHDGTPLHVAAAVGDEARIDLFLKHGAEIDARDVAGWTPLHCAAALCQLEEAMFLVSRGADVGVRDQDGLTPLDIARVHDPQNPLGEQRWGALERLLAGFAIAKVIEARPDSLILEVDCVHTIYPEAYWQAQEQGMIAIPAGLLPEVPEPGDILRCRKGLSPELDEVWEAARKRSLDIEPER